MTFSVFSIAILIIFASSCTICVWRSLEKGFFRSLILLGSSFFSITVSIILSPLLSKLIMAPVFDQVLRRLAEYRDMVALFPSLDATTETLASALLSTLLFVILFFIIRALSYAICMLIGSRAFKNKSDDPGYSQEKNYCGRNNKKLGAIMGIICAVLSTMVLTAPIMGIFDIANTAIVTAEEIMPNVWDNSGIDKNEINQIKKYANDIPGNIFYRFGGELMFSSSAASEFLGKRVYLMQEVDTVSNTIIDFSYVFTVIKNPEKSHGGYLEYIYSLCDDIQDINISHGLIADFISEEFALWKNGSSKYIEKPDIPETLDYAFDNLVDVCTKSTPDNIRENLTTFLKIYAIILDSGIVKCEQTDIVAILTCINTTSLIDRVNAELANNPNLSHISFTSVAMSILTKQIDASDADEELHDKIMSNMAEAISIVRTRGYGSLDEKVSVLTSYTQEYFKEFGIDLSNEMAKYNAEVFINHFAVGDTDVLPGDIEALLDNFRN